GELYNPPRGQAGQVGAVQQEDSKVAASGFKPVQDILAKYNPGVEGQEFTTGNAAKFIAAGSDIVFEIHYTTTGKPETDRSRVGIVLADRPPEKRYVTITGLNNARFTIPAHASNYEIKAETTLDNEVQLAWVQPHMHL